MRFIHLADIHLGAVPDRGYPWSAKREEEIWESFRRVFDRIREDHVDFLLIAGDLFHRQPLMREIREVAALCARIPDTRVYIIAGNHDYLRQDSFMRNAGWPDNVFVFPGEKPECVRDPLLPVYIYGLSYEHQEITAGLYNRLRPYPDAEENALHILLAHGGDARHIPWNIRALLGAGFDYIACGHIHTPTILVPDQAAYSGALEPVDRGDTGRHGYMLGTLERGRLRVKFVPFAVRSYLDLELESTTEDTQTSMEEKARTLILRKGSGNLYRIRLKGIRAPEQVFFPERFRRLGNIVDIRDDTRQEFDLEELRTRFGGTLIGEFIESFGDEKDLTDPVRQKALQYGLQALLQTAQLQ